MRLHTLMDSNAAHMPFDVSSTLISLPTLRSQSVSITFRSLNVCVRLNEIITILLTCLQHKTSDCHETRGHWRSTTVVKLFLEGGRHGQYKCGKDTENASADGQFWIVVSFSVEERREMKLAFFPSNGIHCVEMPSDNNRTTWMPLSVLNVTLLRVPPSALRCNDVLSDGNFIMAADCNRSSAVAVLFPL